MTINETAFPFYDEDGSLECFQAGSFGKVFDEAMPYRFTTEDIAGYLPHLEAAGGRCLTIAGSGDQAIDLLAAGADEVVIFDRMKNALAATDLKMTVLRDWAGDLGSFVQSYGARWPRIRETKRRTYGTREGEEVSRNLEFVEMGGPRLPFFKRGTVSWWLTDYLQNEEKFQAARRAVDVALGHGRVKMFQADIRDLGHLPQLGTFDVIVLSNVVSTIVRGTGNPVQTCHAMKPYMLDGHENVDRVRSIYADTVWRAARLLRPDGAMMADFLYGVEGYSHPHGLSDPMAVMVEVDDADPGLKADLERQAEYRRRRQDEWAAPDGFSVSEFVTGDRSMGGHDVAVVVRRESDRAYDRSVVNRAFENPELEDHRAASWRRRQYLREMRRLLGVHMDR